MDHSTHSANLPVERFAPHSHSEDGTQHLDTHPPDCRNPAHPKRPIFCQYCEKLQVRLAGNRAQEQFVTNVIKQTIIAAEFPVPATVKPEN
jgi:hypothetical protein